MKDLAAAVRDRECQIIISTHSPYILEELPLLARLYILETGGDKPIVSGVSPEFSMTKMDDERHPECEVYVEDVRSAVWPELFIRCDFIPYGAANLGVALGQMTQANRFPRRTRVFLDGDQGTAPGCTLLPGEDAPERVVFERLRRERWRNLWTRVSRDIANVSDTCERAMTLADHHEWVRTSANSLRCGGDTLWQGMCCEWSESIPKADIQYILNNIEDAFT